MKAVISILLALTALAAHASDQELFDRARALWDQGQQKEAAKAFRDLIKNYPTSKYVPDAYLAFGEYYFDQNNVEKALMAYKKVVEFRDSKVYSYAMYKMGWCYYNIMEYDRALAQFVAVVRHCDKRLKTGQGTKLRKEALNDIALVYSHAQKANTAPTFFKRLAPKEAKSLLAKLGSIYYGDGKFKEATTIYRHLIANSACSADSPRHQLKIINSMVRMGLKESIPREIENLGDLFGQLQKCLRTPTAEQQKKLDLAREEAERTLYDLVIFSHREANQPEAFRLVRKLANYYLQMFPHSPRADKIRGLIR